MQSALRTTLTVTLPCGCEINREVETRPKDPALAKEFSRQMAILDDRVTRRIAQHTCEAST